MSVQDNFISPREFELIEYPGTVKNVDKMIATLGGLTNVCQALGSEKKLELRYHPDNPFSKGAFGESSARAGYLISIKVRRSKKHPEKPPKYVVHILGHCKRIITFENLCDFQYLPLLPNDDPNVVQPVANALNSILPKSVTDTKYFTDYNMPLFSMPNSFARSDCVHPFILRTDILEDGQQDVLGVLQKSTYDNRDVVTFNMVDYFPERPDPLILKRMKVKYVSDEQLETVKQLFEKCPVWTRYALMYESGISVDKLKCIIPSVAYFFSSGPWRTMYVRYGYDPRKDFASRYYQTFDFRLRFRSGVSEFVSRRSDTVKKKQENPEELNALAQDVDYPYYEENKLPRARQCILRYMDVHMPKVQDMLDKIPSPATGAVCNEKTGWLPNGFDNEVRIVVSNSVMQLLKSHYRKEQIHAEVDSVHNGENEEASQELEEDFDTGYDVNEFLNENIQNVFDEMQIDNDAVP